MVSMASYSIEVNGLYRLADMIDGYESQIQDLKRKLRSSAAADEDEEFDTNNSNNATPQYKQLIKVGFYMPFSLIATVTVLFGETV